ncbi:MAG TPA: DUF2089 family protein [Ktedonobacterales bacterium]
MPDPARTYPIITRDPVTGDELLVTRLEGATSGITIEGRFAFGWLGRLAPAQLEFVRLLALHRGNIQKVAADLGIAYNTARARGDEIAATLGDTAGDDTAGDAEEEAGEGEARSGARRAILDRVFDGSLSVEEALRRLKGGAAG